MNWPDHERVTAPAPPQPGTGAGTAGDHGPAGSPDNGALAGSQGNGAPRAAASSGAPGVTARVRSRDGWAVRGAVLTITDMAGRQVARAEGDDDGLAVTGPLQPGTYTAIIMAAGFSPAARTAVLPASGSATLGTITLERSLAIELPPPGRWSIDPVHSSVTVTARHLGVASVRVRINRFAGTIEIAEPVERSTVRARLEAGSIDSQNRMRDDDLRSANFLDVATYPFIDYVGTGVTPQGDGHWAVDGELTLHGVSRPVQLDLAYQGTSPDPWGSGTRAAFRATTRLRRDLFGINWNESLLPGVPMIGPELQVDLDIEAIQGELPDALKQIIG
ncbi:MAG TPA: YceI family protein [Streptosporangiaceae bacterium]|nr:YceI family protein [Streptosporangiaceae bacterium]